MSSIDLIIVISIAFVVAVIVVVAVQNGRIIKNKLLEQKQKEEAEKKAIDDLKEKAVAEQSKAKQAENDDILKSYLENVYKKPAKKSTKKEEVVFKEEDDDIDEISPVFIKGYVTEDEETNDNYDELLVEQDNDEYDELVIKQKPKQKSKIGKGQNINLSDLPDEVKVILVSGALDKKDNF